MKKICFALGVLFMAIASASADDNELVKTASSISTKSSGEISTDSIYWTFPGSTGLNLNQAYFNDYCMEGSGLSISADAFLNLNANYKKNRIKWDNSFAAKYGMIYSSDFTKDEPIRKNMDEFGLYSKIGYKMAQYWYASALASLESQFTNSYKYVLTDPEEDIWKPEEMEYLDKLYESNEFYESDRELLSSFFAPGAIKVSLGFDYVPNKYISFFMSPLTARFTICRLNELAPNYGMEQISPAVTEIDELTGEKKTIEEAKYEKSRSELGAYAILRSDFDITKNIHFFSSLEAFYAYNKAISVYTNGYTDWYGDNYTTFAWDRAISDSVLVVIPYNEKDDSNIREEYTSLNPGKDITKFAHGWSFRWKLELMMKLTKYINLSFRTQLRYDNAEMKTLRDKNNGMPHAKMQFWEAASLGIAYQF